MKRIATLVLIASALLLTGCATTRTVSSQVTAVATAPAGTQLQGAKYRFERLPLQVHNPEAGLAEQQAEQALAAVGLVRDDAQAPERTGGFSKRAICLRPLRPTGCLPLRPYGAIGVGRNGAFGYNWGWSMNTPPMTDYRREVSLILRDLRTGQVVYETHASHYGVWRDSEAIFATLFKAALANFPNPPAGEQRVNIEIPN